MIYRGAFYYPWELYLKVKNVLEKVYFKKKPNYYNYYNLLNNYISIELEFIEKLPLILFEKAKKTWNGSVKKITKKIPYELKTI